MSQPGPDLTLYPRPADLRPPPNCVVCGAPIGVDVQPVPHTDRVVIVNASCPNDVDHNARNAQEYGGHLERFTCNRL